MIALVTWTGWMPDTPGQAAWLGLGFVGQMLFASRWLVQWLASEKRKESVMPVSFWWLSLIGGVAVLAYAIYKREPVLLLGQWGVVVYARNLVLLRRTQKELERRRAEG